MEAVEAWEWGGEKEQLNQGSALLGLAEASKFRATLLPMPVPMSLSWADVSILGYP